MQPSELRANLRQEFERWFRIDRWGVGLPESIRDPNKPPSLGREKPLTEVLSIERPLNLLQSGVYLVRERRSLHAVYLLPRTLQFEEIVSDYRNALEDRTASFSGYLQHSPERIGVKAVDRVTARVACRERTSGDWLLFNTVELDLTYEGEVFCPQTPLFDS